MLGKFVLWLCTVVFAFSLGAQSADPKPADSELEQKIRDHMDVIVDEAAGIVDDIAEEVRNDERMQEASEFVDGVKEIVEHTQEDIEDHFGPRDGAPTEAEDGADADGEGAPAEEPEASENPEEFPGASDG